MKNIEIRPIYSTFIKSDYPNIVYHISPSSNDESILKNGIIATNTNKKKKGIHYPSCK